MIHPRLAVTFMLLLAGPAAYAADAAQLEDGKRAVRALHDAAIPEKAANDNGMF